MSSAIVLETRGLAKSFGSVSALAGVDLEVHRGDRFGFLGQNGAGKTTTIRVLARLLRADAGSAALLGEDVARTAAGSLFRRVGFLVETPAFFPGFSGRDNLGLHARLLELDDPGRASTEVLARVGLSSVADRKVGGWSLGMRQRLGLAQALLGEPELLILDEPTNGLDPGGIQEVRELLRAQAEQHGRTVFLSSHLLGEVESLCNRVAIVDAGRTVAQGEVAEFLRGGSLVLRTSDDARARTALAAGNVVATSRDGGALEIAAADDATCARAVRLVVEAGIDVHEAARARKSLEDAYRGVVARRADAK